MNENTKKKGKFGQWIEDHDTQIVVGAIVVGIAAITGGYYKYLYHSYKGIMADSAAFTAAAIEKVNSLECKECIGEVVTAVTGE